MRYCSIASLLFTTTLGWACNVLALEPGQHVGLTVRWPLIINGGFEDNNTDLNFAVDGCDDFALQVLHRRVDGDWQSVPASFERMARGRYITHLGAEHVAGANSHLCYADADRPYEGELQLRLTCAGDGREAQSQAVPVHFVPAEKSRYLPDVAGLAPLEDRGRAMAFGDHWMGLYDPNARPWFVSSDEPLGRWILDYSTVAGGTFKAHGNVGYVAGFCELPSCGKVRLPDGQGEADVSYIYTLDLETPKADPDLSHPLSRFPLVKDFVTVPGYPLLLHVDEKGLVVVASVRGERSGTFVYRLEGKTVVPMHFWSGEWVNDESGSETHDDLLFLTHNARVIGAPDTVQWALRSIYSDTAVPIPATPTTSRVVFASLSPDGRQWVFDVGADVYLGGLGQSWSRIFTRPNSVFGDVGLRDVLLYQWSERSLFVTSGFHVDVYARDGEHSLSGSYDADGRVVGDVLRDGRLALQSEDSIVFLGSDGVAHGKINLPPCGEFTYARPVELIGGTLAATVKVQGSAQTLFFPIPQE